MQYNEKASQHILKNIKHLESEKHILHKNHEKS